jgi:hypothetical protein
MSRSDPRIQVYVTEKLTTNLIVAAHRHPQSADHDAQNPQLPFFNSLLMPGIMAGGSYTASAVRALQ